MTGFTLRKFRGSEIQTEIVNALDLIPAAREIVTFSAEENGPIKVALAPQDVDVSGFGIMEYAWDGESWHEIGEL